MNAVGSRHMFWQAPPSPFLTNGPLRTIPLRNSGRPVLMGGLFMGQASTNRLDNISIPAIIGRIQISPLVQDYLQKLRDTPPPVNARGYPYQAPLPPPPSFPPMTDAEHQILFEIAQNPSPEELEDLVIIDSLFNPIFSDETTSTTADVCQYAAFGYVQTTDRISGKMSNPALKGFLSYLKPSPGPVGRGLFVAPKGPDLSSLDEKFYCTDTKSRGRLMPITKQTIPSLFGIDATKPWGEIKQAAKNALLMLQVYDSYPFPPPLDLVSHDIKGAWLLWQYTADQLPKMVNGGKPLDPEVVRMWMTLVTLQYYEIISDAIIQDAKSAAKRNKRKALIAAIGIAVVGIIAAIILPALIYTVISVVQAGIKAYMDAKERQKAAKDLADTARLFEADAPAFAAEVQKTADMLDSAAAQEQAAKPLTLEQQAAIKDIEETTPSSTPVGIYVVGGVAATGLIAALVTLLR